MKSQIVLYNINTSPGAKVIIDHLISALADRGIKLVEQSNCDDTKAVYIPYGPKCAYICAKRKRTVWFNLMVDYYSLGCKNRALSLLKNGYVFSKIFWVEVVTYFLYYFREYVIFKELDNHVLVSYSDILKLKKRFPDSHCFHLPNGCTIPGCQKPKVLSSKIRLGILSNWTLGTLADVHWFIDKYFPIIQRAIPNVELYVAGKCEIPQIEKYFEESGAIYLGWVDSLDVFFDNLDIYIATVPKGCGILNKVMDAFVHRTFVIGEANSFSGFHGLENGFVSCKTVNDYIKAITMYIDKDPFVNTAINNAYNYIRKFDWDHTYNEFVSEMICLENDEK